MRAGVGVRVLLFLSSQPHIYSLTYSRYQHNILLAYTIKPFTLPKIQLERIPQVSSLLTGLRIKSWSTSLSIIRPYIWLLKIQVHVIISFQFFKAHLPIIYYNPSRHQLYSNFVWLTLRIWKTNIHQANTNQKSEWDITSYILEHYQKTQGKCWQGWEETGILIHRWYA